MYTFVVHYRFKICPAVKERDNEFVNQYYVDHKEYHAGDAGYDLFCPGERDPEKAELSDGNIVVPKGAIGFKIPLGIKVAAYRSDIPVSFYLYPRSSLATKTPLRLANSVGIIDSGYRGELIAVVDNIDRENDFVIEKGTRLFQLCGPDLGIIYPEVVEELDKTSRGTGGFGSTG